MYIFIHLRTYSNKSSGRSLPYANSAQSKRRREGPRIIFYNAPGTGETGESVRSARRVDPFLLSSSPVVVN